MGYYRVILWGSAQIPPQSSSISVTLLIPFNRYFTALAIHASTTQNEALGIAKNGFNAITIGKDTPTQTGQHTIMWFCFGI